MCGAYPNQVKALKTEDLNKCTSLRLTSELLACENSNQCSKSFESKTRFETPQKSLRLTCELFVYKTGLNHHSKDSNWHWTNALWTQNRTYSVNLNRLPAKIKTLILPRRILKDLGSTYTTITILIINAKIMQLTKNQENLSNSQRNMIKRCQPQDNLDIGTIIDFKAVIINYAPWNKRKHIWNEGKGRNFQQKLETIKKNQMKTH